MDHTLAAKTDEIKARGERLWNFQFLGHTCLMVESELQGEVLVLTMARAPVNAFDFEMLDRVTEAISGASERAAVVIFTGSGSCFTAGLDIKMFAALKPDGQRELQTKLDEVVDAFALCSVPIAAAVNGHAIGIGAILVALADFRVAVHGSYQIGLPEVKVGLVLPRRIHKVVARSVGARRADRLITEGFSLSPEQAQSWGLIDERVDADVLLETAEAWCERLLALPRANMLATRAEARADIHDFIRIKT